MKNSLSSSKVTEQRESSLCFSGFRLGQLIAGTDVEC